MKVWLVALAGLFSISVFVSCQKEVDGTVPEEISYDSTYLVKTVSLDTTMPSGQDTAIIFEYFYDTQKRLTQYTLTEVSPSGMRDFYWSKLKYNGNDTLPYKMSNTYSSSTDSNVIYYNYSGGFIIKDSTIYYRSGVPEMSNKRFYTSVGNNRFLLLGYNSYLSLGITDLSDSTIYIRTIVGRNIATSVDTFFDGHTKKVVRTFDDKKNPFAKIPVWYNGYYTHLLDDETISGVNNITVYSFNTDIPLGTNFTFSISYIYNSDGYPVIARLSGNPDVNKVLYFYTKM